MTKSFSYVEYSQIIEHLAKISPLMDYSQVDAETEGFTVIRHDVEYSVDRALNLAKFEKNNLGICSSYLFQIRNNCYNIGSDVNLEKIEEIQSLGHHVGVHVHLGLKHKSESIVHYVEEEAHLFQLMTGVKVDRFSFHRPTSDELKIPVVVPHLINCYDPLFFHHYETPHHDLDVKYLTDSKHKWQHGYPLDCTHKKIQLLTHPYSWSKKGEDNFENYSTILKEKDLEARFSINRETSTFPAELLKPK